MSEYSGNNNEFLPRQSFICHTRTGPTRSTEHGAWVREYCGPRGSRLAARGAVWRHPARERTTYF